MLLFFSGVRGARTSSTSTVRLYWKTPPISFGNTVSPTSHLTRVNWLVFFAIHRVLLEPLSLKKFFWI